MDILEIIGSLLAFAGAIVAVLLIYKLIQFLFTNWYTSRILSVIAAIGSLVKTILSKEDINEVDFLIIGVLSAASFYLWVNPYAFQIDYETAIIDFDRFGNAIFIPRETISYFVLYGVAFATTCAINFFLFNFAGGMFSIALPALMILVSGCDFLRKFI
jgi:hypothetical protein